MKTANQFMWGSTQRFAFSNAEALLPAYFGKQGPQLVQLEVPVPQTWSFTLHCKVLSITPGAVDSVFLNWDLVLGVGRAQVTLLQWGRFDIDPSVVNPITGLPPDQFATSLSPAAGTTTSTNEVFAISARSIVLSARVSTGIANPGINYALELSAFVAPWTNA